MVRSSVSGSEQLYALHDEWLHTALPDGDSLLTPGVRIWTDEHLDELTRHFVESPDDGQDKYLTKLNRQMRGASPGAVQLMAELHVISFLIVTPAAISATRKLSNIETVLSWMPEPPHVPERVRQAMGVGLVHPGRWVLNRRDTQIAWGITFARAFRALPDSVAVASDPWRLRDFTLSIQDDQAEGARLAVLHLAHPETFEATVSPRHRAQIQQRFAHLSNHDEDVDRALLDIRAALEPVYGAQFSFYGEPLNRQWPRDPQWRKLVRWVGNFRSLPDFGSEEREYKIDLAGELARVQSLVRADDSRWLDELQAVFRSSRNNLTSWRMHEPLLGWMRRETPQARAALQELWTDKPVSPSGAWHGPLADRVDRFVSMVPPALLSTKGKRLNLIAFLLMANGAEQHPPLTARLVNRAWALSHWGSAPKNATDGASYVRWLLFLDELVHDGTSSEPPVRDRLDVQSALWQMLRCEAAPASWSGDLWQEFVTFRGEKYVADEDGEEFVDRSAGHSTAMLASEATSVDDEAEDAAESFDQYRDRLQEAADALLLPRSTIDGFVELLDDKGQIILYGPPGTGKTYVAMHLAEAIAGDAQRTMLVQFHPSTSYEDFIEGLRPQITASGQVTYTLTEGPLVAMARAASADPDRMYVLVIDEINRANLPKVLGELLFLLEYRERAARLLYRPEEPFRLPANLWIIGTMNTADRSVALIDAAMRRRFNFVPFFPDHGPMKGMLQRWLSRNGMRADVAPFLDAVNSDLRAQLGPHLAIGPSHFMKPSLTDAALERIWDANVFPLLEEFFWGDEQVEAWRWASVRHTYRSILGPLPGDDSTLA